jgi:hypothetical protein
MDNPEHATGNNSWEKVKNWVMFVGQEQPPCRNYFYLPSIAGVQGAIMGGALYARFDESLIQESIDNGEYQDGITSSCRSGVCTTVQKEGEEYTVTVVSEF